MKRLHYFNLLGVLLLAALCVAQWQINRRLNLEATRLDRLRQEHEGKLAEQERAAKGMNADLETFRSQFARANDEARESARKLAAGERLTAQLQRERDQLKASVTNWATASAQLKQSVTNWAAAVTERDARLTEANTRLQQLGEELNASIRKFNELVATHNASITQFNELAARHEKLVKDWNDQQAKLAAGKQPAEPDKP